MNSKDNHPNDERKLSERCLDPLSDVKDNGLSSRQNKPRCGHRWHLMRWPNPMNNDIADFLCDKCGKMKKVVVQWE